MDITGGAQTIERGLSLTFGATTGHRKGDRWTFRGAPANIIVNRFVGGSATVQAHLTRDALQGKSRNKSLWDSSQSLPTPRPVTISFY